MPPKVLVIDDDPYLLPVMVEALNRCGFAALAAEDGNAGMRMFAAERPALVVTDILMPDKEGLATILDLKRNPSPPKVIAISGGGRLLGNDFLRWAKHLGADEVMAKPFLMSALVATAREVLAQ